VKRLFLALTPALALVLAGAATPARAQFGGLSADDERKLAAEQHPLLVKENGGVYNELKLDEYVAQIGFNMVPHVEEAQPEWQFTLLDTPLVNAFATTAGHVYITRGILALSNTEAEVAGVVGHEMGHITAHHISKKIGKSQMAQVGAGLLGVLGAVLGGQAVGDVAGQLASAGGALWVQKFSREEETEADTLGLRTIGRTGYAPQAMASFMQSLNDYSALSARQAGRPGAEMEFSLLQSHPRTVDRIEQLQREVGQPAGNPFWGRDAFLDRINGILYGDSAEQGFIRDRVFAHPGLRLTFTAPPGFRLANGADAVAGSGANGLAMRFDSAPKNVAGSNPRDYLVRVWGAKAQLQNVETYNANGMAVATGTAVGQSQSGAQVQIRLVAIAAPAGMYRFVFQGPVQAARQMDGEFRKTIASFRPLSAAEAAALKPLRVRVVPVRAGDTEEGFAARMPFGQWNLEEFRVLNGLRTGERIAAGQRVKIVTD
jgi:predicted Zn-dependent protease